MFEGLDFAKRLGIRVVMVERDAQQIFCSFEKNEQDLSHTRLILVDAYGLASRFLFFKAHYIPRNCNSIADGLA